MLSVNDLRLITSKPKLNDFNFITLLDFYEQHLCDRLFVYHLGDPINQTIKLRFEKDKLCHLLGFQHIFKYRKNAKQYVGNNGYRLLREGKITFKTFKEKDLQVQFKSKKNRILYFPFVHQIVHNPTAILFSNVGLPTNIETEFIFYNINNQTYLHLGVDSDGQNPYYFPKTFLERNNRDFVDGQRPVVVLRMEEILD